jgi:hypothetical protein
MIFQKYISVFYFRFSDDNFHKIIFNYLITENSFLEFRTVLATLVIENENE